MYTCITIFIQVYKNTYNFLNHRDFLMYLTSYGILFQCITVCKCMFLLPSVYIYKMCSGFVLYYANIYVSLTFSQHVKSFFFYP